MRMLAGLIAERAVQVGRVAPAYHGRPLPPPQPGMNIFFLGKKSAGVLVFVYLNLWLCFESENAKKILLTRHLLVIFSGIIFSL